MNLNILNESTKLRIIIMIKIVHQFFDIRIINVKLIIQFNLDFLRNIC